MTEDVIKDASGRTLGFLRTTPNGRQEAYNTDRQYQGYFDEQNKLTKDRAGATVAKGNIVGALIFGRK